VTTIVKVLNECAVPRIPYAGVNWFEFAALKVPSGHGGLLDAQGQPLPEGAATPGASGTPAVCGLYAVRVAVPQSQVLTSVELGPAPDVVVAALSVRRGTAATASQTARCAPSATACAFLQVSASLTSVGP
jgi:hypothetical protein